MKEIFDVFYSFATDYIKVYLTLWGIINLPLIKNKKLLLSILITQTVAVIIAALFNQRFPNEVMFFRLFLVILAVGLILQGNFFKKLAYSLLAYITILFLDSCIIGIASLYSNMSGHEVLTSYVSTLFINTINIFTIGLIVLYRKRYKNIVQINISKRIYALLFFGAATGFITLAALLVRSNDEATEAARKIMIIVTIIVVIAYNAACLMMIIITESRDNYKSLSLINQNIIESQQQYYTLVNEKQQEMQGIRHEMKNHLACIHALYQANKLVEMEQYIDQLVEASNISYDLFDTGNDIVNAILNDAQSKYKKDNIVISLKGSFPEEMKVAPMDLCVIFANLVSNAIEAILRMEREKEDISCIDINIKSFKDDLFIDIKNPTGKIVDIYNGKLLTSKEDKKLHGFGVKNIIQRVEKYHGTVDFTSEDNEFFVEIYMKNNI